MSYNAIVGTNLEISEFFYDDYGDPIVLSDNANAPVLVLIDPSDRSILASTVVQPGLDAAQWVANIAIPELDISERVTLRVTWSFETDEGLIKYSDVVFVDPSDEKRTGDLVVLEQNPRASFILPVPFDINVDVGSYTMYSGNDSLGTVPLDDPTVIVQSKVDHSIVSGTFATQGASLEPYLMQVEYQRVGMVVPQFVTYNIWIINPSILSAMHSIEDFINKSRIRNVIPELEYTQADLLEYLRRGLSLFNVVQQITGFTGLNMKGIIRECWLICSTYYALGAQLQAEGSMAFDFSGQTVNLNIDRSPAIEGALGRIEGQIDNVVKPAKKDMLKAGVDGGDGSNPATNKAQNFGRLGISNAATTKLVGAQSRYFRRF